MKRKNSFKCKQRYPTQTEKMYGVYALVWQDKAYVGSSVNIGQRVGIHISNFVNKSQGDKATQALITEAGGVANVELYYEALLGLTEDQLHEVEASFAKELSSQYTLVNPLPPGTNAADLPEFQPRPVLAIGLSAGPLWFDSICAAARELKLRSQSKISDASRGVLNKHCKHGGTHRYGDYEFYTPELFAQRQNAAHAQTFHQQELFFGVSGCAAD